jgi:branched-chain amino acid transport system substrate-binding protein
MGAAALAVADDAVSDGVVRVGLILDMSQSLSYLAGEGSVTAAHMAVEDFGGSVLGSPVEVVSADHKNRADLAADIAREWFDPGKVDAVMDVTASPPALAVARVAREKNRIVVVNGAGTLRLTNEACNPVTMHWAFDTYALAHVTARELIRSGGDTWYFVTADNTFGQGLEKDTTRVVRAEGGRVLGTSLHAINAPDFNTHLLRAQQSGAKVIALATAGQYFIDAMQAAYALGVTAAGKQRLAALTIYVNDIHRLGLKSTQGLYFASAFDWDLRDETRAWAGRFFTRTGKMPNMAQAGVYSATLHYLKAAQAAGTDRTADVVAKMRELPVDFFGTAGRVRDDGRMVHEMYWFEVKAPAESGSPWDYLRLRGTIPGEQAFQAPEKGACRLPAK